MHVLAAAAVAVDAVVDVYVYVESLSALAAAVVTAHLFSPIQVMVVAIAHDAALQVQREDSHSYLSLCVI